MATGDSTDELALVEVENEQYSLIKVPAETSAVVVAERKRLLGELDLEALVDDLSRAGKFIRVAYNGVAGNTELQITVQGIGYDVSKLCDKASITVVKFTRASNSVILDLQSTYEYLLDGLEEMAVDTLGAVSKLAGDMAVAAKELGKAFQEEEEKIEKTLKETQLKKGEEEKYKQENEKHKQRQAEAIKTKEAAAAAEKKSEEAYRQAQQEEIKNAAASSGLTALSVLSVCFLPFAAPLTIAGAVVTGKKAREARQEKIRQLEAMKHHGEERKKAFKEIAEFARKIQEYDANAEMGFGGDAAIDALHEAVGALKSLTVVMMRAADFWGKMQVHCASISDMKMDERLEKALKVGEAKRKAVWASPAFKRGAIYYFAQWVALQGVCVTYSKKIKTIQEQLYSSIQENPTREQSRASIRAIASDLLKEIEEANKTIAEEQAQSDKKIKELEEADKEGK